MSNEKQDAVAIKAAWRKLQRDILVRIETIEAYSHTSTPEALLAISQATIALIALEEKIK